MDFGLKNRRALAMGGTKGLGRSIADALAEEGAALTISGRDQGRLDEAAAALRAKGAAARSALSRTLPPARPWTGWRRKRSRRWAAWTSWY